MVEHGSRGPRRALRLVAAALGALGVVGFVGDVGGVRWTHGVAYALDPGCGFVVCDFLTCKTSYEPAGTPCPSAILDGSCQLPSTCDGAGRCAHNFNPDDTPCDDLQPCTIGDQCVAGECRSGAPLVCPGGDACHDAPACDPRTGGCPAPVAKPDGAPCDDGDACTTGDACTDAVCAGVPSHEPSCRGFDCLRARTAPDGAAIAPLPGVTIADDLARDVRTVLRPFRYCEATGGAAGAEASGGLACHRLSKERELLPSFHDLVIEDRFGMHAIEVARRPRGRRETICLEAHVPDRAPDGSYRCFRVTGVVPAPGSGEPLVRLAGGADAPVLHLGRLRLYCAPASLDGGPPPAGDSLACRQVEPPAGGSPAAPPDVTVTTDLGSELLRPRWAKRLFCTRARLVLP